MLVPAFLRGGAVAALLLTLLVAAPMPVSAAAFAAGTAKGGHSTYIHKMPGRTKSAVKCRICAGPHCTVVTVRKRCTRKAALTALRLKQHSRRRRAINPPRLDDRRYDSLHPEARRRIPGHTPEWTDHKSSDPGTTILELARRHPHSIRVRQIPSTRQTLPEMDDEVLMNFEHGDSK